MFENLVAQPAGKLLTDDIRGSRLPPSILLSGQYSAGKLTAALELARILSCHNKDAAWSCLCVSCVQHRELAHPDLLLIGPRDCLLEIRAAAAAFLRSRSIASRYLFIRSVRKLAIRFNPVLAENGDDAKTARAAPLLSDISELLEELSPTRSLPEDTAYLEKIVSNLIESSDKLEQGCLPDSIPVNQIRNAASWARLSPSGHRKVLIIDNADKMQDSARNAFLKVLEEPPSNVVFILTTNRRGAILPTILSRVRTYGFIDRCIDDQQSVISRVFHDTARSGELLSGYFNRFLPVTEDSLLCAARAVLEKVLLQAIDEGKRPLVSLRIILDASEVSYSSNPQLSLSEILVLLNRCKPSVIWNLFLAKLILFFKSALSLEQHDAREVVIISEWNALIASAKEEVTIYNISPQASLEKLIVAMKDTL